MTEHPVKAFGWAAKDTSGILSPFNFSRRATGDNDVQLKVLYCGICHSDLHMIKSDWGFTEFPVIPGHEIVGIVTEVGKNVEKFKSGDRVGVGCLVQSCRTCESCKEDLENHCPGQILTYNSRDVDGTITYGGYSDIMVCDEHFVIRWPENLPLDVGAPLLCAGITTYSPMRYFGLDKPGMQIGVVGLGGLGHVAVKFAKAFGSQVTVISSNPNKRDEALESLGADSFFVSSDIDQMKTVEGTLDGIVDTVSAVHSLEPLLNLLKHHGKLIMVGVPSDSVALPVLQIVSGRKIVAGSCIGGLKETQEMIDFAAKHEVLPMVEVVPIDYVNAAMDRLARSDVKYRFVLDIGNSMKPTD